MCKSPNIVCLDEDMPSEVCTRFDFDLTPLFRFLNANKALTGFDPQLDDYTTETTRMYACDGFKDNPYSGWFLASMCAALNRGQCPMPTISDLSGAETFKDWHTTKCGHTQFHQGPSMWFAQPVHNPWVKYIRQTL